MKQDKEMVHMQSADRAKEDFSGCGICGARLEDIQEILTATCEHCAQQVDEE